MGINYDAALPAVAYPVGRSSINISDWMQSVKGNLAYLIRQAFRGGEVGFAYDPNDLTTLYQDAAGTIPVTGEGQPVGLVLDKSKGLVVGANVFTSAVNGYFDVGSTSETLTGTLEKTTVWMSVTPETFYKLESNGGVADRCRIQVKNALGVISFVSDFSTVSAATYPRYAKTNSDSVQMRVYFKSSGGNATGLMVRAVAGNHAYQTTSASRPILRRNATTGAYYLEFDGTDDFLVTNSINFTATDKVTLFAGVRKLSDSAGSIVGLSTAPDPTDGTFELLQGVLPNQFGTNLRGTARVGNWSSGVIYNSPISAVISSKQDISGTTKQSLRINNVLATTSTVSVGTGNLSAYPLYVGRRGGTSLPFTGHIYGLIGIGRLTTDSETIALEKSIAKNVGVTL